MGHTETSCDGSTGKGVCGTELGYGVTSLVRQRRRVQCRVLAGLPTLPPYATSYDTCYAMYYATYYLRLDAISYATCYAIYHATSLYWGHVIVLS
eukprot:3941608-Rhodomonas_salina.2